MRALKLFVGEASDTREVFESAESAVDKRTGQLAAEQNHRLVFDMLASYDQGMAHRLLAWLKGHIAQVFELCFAAGAVKERENWSNVLWYKNVVDQEGNGLDDLVDINRVRRALVEKGNGNLVEKGPQNGGSTIQLPFGHVQYHLGQLEFYQKMKKIRTLSEASS